MAEKVVIKPKPSTNAGEVGVANGIFASVSDFVFVELPAVTK